MSGAHKPTLLYTVVIIVVVVVLYHMTLGRKKAKK